MIWNGVWLPLNDDSLAEFVKMLSIGVLERGVILVGTLICGDNKNGSHVTCENCSVGEIIKF